MSAKSNYFKLGAFVLTALAIAIALVIWLSGNNWLRGNEVMETYFNESVQGLEVGSKAKYRGVVVGEVSQISFTYTKYELDKPLNERHRYVLVEVSLDSRHIDSHLRSTEVRDSLFPRLIEEGLRVRLSFQGLTGTSYLEIDYVDPTANPPLPTGWTPQHFYIPSARSTATQFVSAAAETMTRLKHLDIEGTLANTNRVLLGLADKLDQLNVGMISAQATQLMDKLDDKVDALPVDRLGKELTALVSEVRRSNQSLQRVLADPVWRNMPQQATATLGRAREVLEGPQMQQSLVRLERTLSRVDRMVGGGEGNLAITLENLRQATDNLRDLSEDLKRNPSQLILGGPPRR